MTFTHLSPLITYHSPDTWRFTRENATAPLLRDEATRIIEGFDERKRFSFEYISQEVRVRGESLRVEHDIEPPLEENNNVMDYTGRYYRAGGNDPTPPNFSPYIIFEALGMDNSYQYRNMSLTPHAGRETVVNTIYVLPPVPRDRPVP